MKQKSYFNLFFIAVFLLVFQLFTSRIHAQPVRVTMNINYDLWTANDPDWYNAIYFSDDTPSDTARGDNNSDNDNRKGLSFKTNVGNRRATVFFWNAIPRDSQNIELKDVKIILVRVSRKPIEGGDIILNQTWYNSNDGGRTIRGVTRQAFSGGRPDPNDPERTIYQERYIIDFALIRPDGEIDTFTIDPIVRGHN